MKKEAVEKVSNEMANYRPNFAVSAMAKDIRDALKEADMVIVRLSRELETERLENARLRETLGKYL